MEGLISDVLNREKMGSPAHLDVMENTGRMYVNPHLTRVLHFCYLWLQFVFPVSSVKMEQSGECFIQSFRRSYVVNEKKSIFFFLQKSQI